LSVLLLLSLGVGLVLGGLASSVYYLRYKRENIALRRQRKIVEEQASSSAPRLSRQ
jgi:putative membrane protein